MEMISQNQIVGKKVKLTEEALRIFLPKYSQFEGTINSICSKNGNFYIIDDTINDCQHRINKQFIEIID